MTVRQLVFVYGTLKRGGSNHSFIADQTFVGEARTEPGFSIINLGEYPGLIADAKDSEGVAGEVWSVDQPSLAQLDQLEGLDEGLYVRARIALQSPFAHDEVHTYFYALGTSGRPSIPGGVWPNRKQ